MILSADEYYDVYLKGNSESAILTEINKLKKKLAELKNEIENPTHEKAEVFWRNAKIQVYSTRAYLERAKEALVEAGGKYKPSREEKKEAAFEIRIPAINKVVFELGGFCGGYEKRIVTFSDEKAYLDIATFFSEAPCKSESPVSKKEFLEGLRDLHIGEWLPKYDIRRFGYIVCDGTQWSLEIYFSDGKKPLKISGDNDYPYNFGELQKLLGIEVDEE